MKTVSVGELRQNPTAAFDAVEQGESLIVTRHARPFAQLVPLRASRQRGPSGADLAEWVSSAPFEPVDFSAWQAELAADRAVIDAELPQDPWNPNTSR